MTAVIDTPLLITGGGPAALLVATLTSGISLGSLVVGHRSLSGNNEIELADDSVAFLKPHGVLNVLRPYAASTAPFVINAALFEEVLKHHCVVNMNITVYDEMELFNLTTDQNRTSATMSDGRSQWVIHADYLADTAKVPVELNQAIQQAAVIAEGIITALQASGTA